MTVVRKHPTLSGKNIRNELQPKQKLQTFETSKCMRSMVVTEKPKSGFAPVYAPFRWKLTENIETVLAYKMRSSRREKVFTSMDETRRAHRRLKDENKRLNAQLLNTEEDISGLVNKNYELLARLQEESEIKFETYKKSKVLGEHLKVLLSENNSVRKRLSKEEEQKKKLEQKVKELFEANEYYQKQNDDLMNVVEEERGKAHTNEGEILKLQKQIRTLNEQNFVLMRRTQTESASKTKAMQRLEEFESERKRNHHQSEELSEVLTRNKKLAEDLGHLQAENRDLKAINNRQEEQLSLAKQHAKAIEERLAARDEQVQEMKTRIQKLEKELEEKTENVFTWREHRSSTELEQKKTLLENEQLRRELERLCKVEDAYKESVEKANRLAMNIENLQTRLKDIEQRKKDTEAKRLKENKDAEERIRSILEKLSDSEERAIALESVNGKLTRRLENAAEKLAECEREKTDLNAALKRSSTLNKVIMESLVAGEEVDEGED